MLKESFEERIRIRACEVNTYSTLQPFIYDLRRNYHV